MIKPRISRIGVILAASCLRSAALAQDPAPPPVEPVTQQQGGRTVWSLYWENDGAYVKPNGETDRHYTNGARVVMAVETPWADSVARWLPLQPAEGESLRTSAFYSVGQLIYTPDRIENQANPQPVDRRYAGWLYTSVGLERASQTTADRFDLKLGVIGPASAAEQAQQNIHDIFDPNRQPQGWEDQLSDRVAIDLDLNRRWKFDLDQNDSDYVKLEIIPEIGMTIGTVHRHLMAGATLRVGSVFLPDDFGPGRLEAPTTAVGYPTGPVGPNENLAWSIYTRVEGRAVFHNELLDGVDPEPAFGLIQVGVTLTIQKSLTIGYSQTWYANEFRSQVGRDSIGALTVAWSWEY
ncbi:MAG: lipid A deacylase LpxR family protein [Phycisphaeraceae bacterium]|nr:lipid A deacylase LpxR family protein [Phycisphaeraceae bacterium]